MVIDDAVGFVRYWRGVRDRTRRLLPLVPEDQIEWSPGPGRWTFGDLFRHLAAIERWMYGENVQGLPSRYPGHGCDLAESRHAVGVYHDQMHEEACRIFEALSPAQLTGPSVTPAGVSMTTYKWLRAMVEHEAHHRGQIHLMLGLRGISGPQIFGLTEEEVKARSVG